MNTFIVILRGINVSGKNKLPMQELRELLSTLGFQAIQTYIQSGNIILRSDVARNTIVTQIQTAIKEQYGYDVPVLIRTVEEWEKAIANNPYPIDNHKVLHFTFLSEVPMSTEITVNAAEGDHYTIIDDVVYIYALGGYGKSKLSNNLFEKKLKVTATTRNYKTTMKLLELAKKS